MIKKLDKSKDITKIKDEILSLKKSIINLNFQKSSGQLEKTASIRKAKKDVARLKTQISQIMGEKNA